MHETVIAVIGTLAVVAIIAVAVFLVMRKRKPKPVGGHSHGHKHKPSKPLVVKIEGHHDGTLHEALHGTPISPKGWTKIGLLYPKTSGSMPLQLFERPKDRRRSEYMVELDDEIAIPLNHRKYYDLQTGDEVVVPTREGDGPHKVKLFKPDNLRYDPFRL
jgi:hypothetical protein